MIRLFDDIKEKPAYNDFVAGFSNDGGFLQSWDWSLFQIALGRTVWRVCVVDNGQIKLAAMVIKMPLRFGLSYFYVPRGPIMDSNKSSYALKEFDAWLSAKAKEQNAIFCRVEPAWTDSVRLRNQNYVQTNVEIQPRHTLILDLKSSQEEILKKMKSKTRYNIGLAQKHGVKIKEGQTQQDIEAFYKVLESTTQRQSFKTHSLNYFKKMWAALHPTGALKLLLAYHQNEIIGGILVSQLGRTAIYLHGGMLEARRDLMAPYLLQWQAIQDAKFANCTQYDFWGVAPADINSQSAKEKGWQGITRFKQGFAPDTKITEYPGCFDKVYKSGWYGIYNFAKKWI